MATKKVNKIEKNEEVKNTFFTDEFFLEKPISFKKQPQIDDSLKKARNKKIGENFFRREEELNINLIPEGADIIPEQTTRKNIFSIVIISVLFFIIFSITILFIYGDLFNARIREIIKMNNELDNIYQEERDNLAQIENINLDLKQIEKIYNNHIYWTNFLSFIEENTIDEVQIKDISAPSTSGSITITVVSDDYEDIARQVSVFQNIPETISSVKINTINKTLSDNSVSSKIILEIKKDLLLKK